MPNRVPSFDSDVEATDENSTFLKNGARFPASKWRRCSPGLPQWIWKLTTVIFGFIASVALWYVACHTQGQAAQTTGLKSELKAARGNIEYHDIFFTSGIEEKPDGQMYLRLPEGQPAYVGAPNPAIDAAWADLTQATEIWVNGDDAKGVSNRSISSERGWLVSLDVYHSLHCVNLARKGFDWSYYYGDKEGQEPINYLTRDHIYHCLEHLRQVVMCHSDLTPMRFRWSSIKEGRGMPVWEEPHTCRNFELVRAWAEARKRDFTSSPHMGHS